MSSFCPVCFPVANASAKPLLFSPASPDIHSTILCPLITENFSLSHFDGLTVPCTLRLPHRQSSGRLVIIAPGFLGFKDWGFFPFLAEQLCLAGFATMAFSHALCGVRENPLEITDSLAFSRNSTSQGVERLGPGLGFGLCWVGCPMRQRPVSTVLGLLDTAGGEASES